MARRRAAAGQATLNMRAPAEAASEADTAAEETPAQKPPRKPPKEGGPCKRCGSTESSQWFGVNNGVGPYCKRTQCEKEYQRVRPQVSGPGKRKRSSSDAVSASGSAAPMDSRSFHSLIEIENVLGHRLAPPPLPPPPPFESPRHVPFQSLSLTLCASLIVGRLFNPDTMQWWERNSELDMDLAEDAYLVQGIFAATEGHTGARDMHWLTKDRMQCDLDDARIKQAVDAYISELGKRNGWNVGSDDEDKPPADGEGEGEEGEDAAEEANDAENT